MQTYQSGKTMWLLGCIGLCIWCTPGFQLCSAGRVLYLPFPQFSHIKIMTCMKEELKQYGHELWIATPAYLSQHPALNDSDINLIKMNKLGDVNFDTSLIGQLANVSLYPERASTSSNLLKWIKNYIIGKIINRKLPLFLSDTITNMNRKILSDTALMETIKGKRFDLAVVDGGVGVVNSIIPYKLDIPFCYLSNMQLPWQSGTPTLPSFVPVTAIGTTDRMTFLERVYSMIQHMWMFTMPPFASDKDVSEFAPEKPPISIQQLMGRSLMWFITQDILADYPRPLMPNSKLVGGLCSKDAKLLSGRFKDFYDRSNHGVVVVSFGGSVTELPNHLSVKLYKAFSMTKYDFVWRSSFSSNETSKYLTTNWLPQNDLLGHPKTKLFITHGGANGQYESIYHGVPMLGIPIFADQTYNTKRLQRKGYGLTLDLHENSAEDFTNVINRIIQTRSYKANIMKASQIFRNRPFTPRQEAAYWMDYLIKHGDTYIRSVGLDLPWYQYLCLDLLLFLFVIFLMIMSVCFAAVRCFWHCMYAKKRGIKSKKD